MQNYNKQDRLASQLLCRTELFISEERDAIVLAFLDERSERFMPSLSSHTMEYANGLRSFSCSVQIHIVFANELNVYLYQCIKFLKSNICRNFLIESTYNNNKHGGLVLWSIAYCSYNNNVLERMWCHLANYNRLSYYYVLSKD
jgi:hypothetical protein